MSRVSGNLRIVVTGLIALHPRLGGVAWDYLQYPLGLSRLGHDVYYLEDSGEWPYRLDGGTDPDSWIAHDPSPNIGHLAAVMARFGLQNHWMYRFPIADRWFGLSDKRRAEVLGTADVLINISGTLEHPEHYRHVPRLVYVDSDPVFTQAKLVDNPTSEFAKRVETHDTFLSFGERINDGLFTAGRRWTPTRQPIVLSEWRTGQPARDVFTTIMSWTSYRPTAGGVRLGQKDAELRRFLDLPSRSVAPLEIALGSVNHQGWESADEDRQDDDGAAVLRNRALTPGELLRQSGWRVVDALRECDSLDGYRSYVETSLGEWSVAKSGYVVGSSGWFSCRTACYLASGRPAVVQDTGFSAVIPVGEGLLAFTSTDEAVEAIAAVVADYDRHAKAAREIAESFFDSGAVLTTLIDDVMSDEPSRKLAADA